MGQVEENFDRIKNSVIKNLIVDHPRGANFLIQYGAIIDSKT